MRTAAVPECRAGCRGGRAEGEKSRSEGVAIEFGQGIPSESVCPRTIDEKRSSCGFFRGVNAFLHGKEEVLQEEVAVKASGIFDLFRYVPFLFFCLRLSETEVPTGGSDVFFGKKGSGLFFREQGRRRGGDFVSDSSNGNANFVSRGGISALFLFRRDKTGYICTVTLCGASRLRSTGISCGNDAEALPRKGFPKSANAFEIRKAGRKGMRRSRNSIASVAANRAKRGRFFPWLNGGTE